MAVRLFEGKAHAVAYLQYRVAPHELINRIIGYMESKVGVQHLNRLHHAYMCFGAVLCSLIYV